MQNYILATVFTGRSQPPFSRTSFNLTMETSVGRIEDKLYSKPGLKNPFGMQCHGIRNGSSSFGSVSALPAATTATTLLPARTTNTRKPFAFEQSTFLREYRVCKSHIAHNALIHNC